jgi:prepilin-type N-terminal cleavage/methylation domain-containing protein
MKKDTKLSKGFTVIEVTIVITVIGILVAVAIPVYLDITRQAHIANLKVVEGSVMAWVTMKASEDLIDNGTMIYPLTAEVNEGAVFPVPLDDWADGAAGVLLYSGGKGGSVTYTAVGTPPILYSIDLIYDGVPL